MDAYPLFGCKKQQKFLDNERYFEEKYPLVVVLWFDASSGDPGWETLSVVAHGSAYPVQTVGWLIHHDREGLKLTTAVHMDEDDRANSAVSGRHWIPSGMVVEVKTLRGKPPKLQFGSLPSPKTHAKVLTKRTARCSRR